MAPLTDPFAFPWADRLRIHAAWESCGAFSEQTLTRAQETLGRFVARVTAQGVGQWTSVTTAHCAGFIAAHAETGPPNVATQHARRTTLRMTFRTLRELGYPVWDPTIDIALPPKSSRAARPLTDDEIAMCRAASRMMVNGSLRHAVVWALAEATAVTSEITTLRVTDLDDPSDPHWVALPGTRRHDRRVGELTDWGRAILVRHLATIPWYTDRPSNRIIYRGKAVPGGATAQATASNAIADVMRTCHLHAEPDVRPSSVRGWVGRSLFDAGSSIAEVAQRLGLRSLDAAAADIAYDWRSG